MKVQPMKINILVLLFASLLAFSCKKKETPTPKSTTPPPTYSSLNTFTLKKDGIPYSAGYMFVSLMEEDVLAVETRVSPTQLGTNIYGVIIRRSIQPGTYELADSESEYFSIHHMQHQDTMFGWSHGTLTVLSNDTVAKVMQCTFDMHLYNDGIQQYPHITEGEMKIHY